MVDAFLFKYTINRFKNTSIYMIFGRLVMILIMCSFDSLKNIDLKLLSTNGSNKLCCLVSIA